MSTWQQLCLAPCMGCHQGFLVVGLGGLQERAVGEAALRLTAGYIFKLVRVCILLVQTGGSYTQNLQCNQLLPRAQCL